MTSQQWKWAKASALTLAIATLTACGGGDNKTNDNTGGNVGGDTGGTKISVEQFNFLKQTGTWQSKMDIDATMEYDVDFGGQTAHYLTDLVIAGNSVTSVRYVNDSEVVIANCDGFPEETLTTSDFSDNFAFEDSDEEGNALFCPSGMEVNYYIVSDEHYRIELICDNATLGNFNMYKLSDSAAFDLGSFSFNSEDHNDLNATDGVCGSHMFSDANITVTTNGQVEESSNSATSITVEAPYGDTKVSLMLEFPTSITTGTYDVIDFFDDANSDDVVSVMLMSSAFGGTPSDPASLSATMGSVTISAISDTAVSGTFDIATYTGDNIDGSFSFDINK
ncbi:hypothetical protein [Saccharophagus degradans]|uniref:Lipoprotein n=1 Tax=Saccharophagus degradans TaxID=86304 RepID=A0AAW7X9R3_9GAMM|nr:hypothetical protein [Saccharophagus degradans]MDO6424300.1 hypothetical protein [Saccharophagus degradans]MDO6608493.1 hypothetical protein [Saccharophagus degradans]